jgi:hypothetical protein
LVGAFETLEKAMSDFDLQRMGNFGRGYFEKAVNVLYFASTASVLASGLALLLMSGLGLFVGNDLIHLPVIHPA